MMQQGELEDWIQKIWDWADKNDIPDLHFQKNM